eukprot:10407292-Karenia_brevis.AAC.1
MAAQASSHQRLGRSARRPPCAGQDGFKARVKSFLKPEKAQNAAKSQLRSMMTVCCVVIQKKGAASRS